MDLLYFKNKLFIVPSISIITQATITTWVLFCILQWLSCLCK